MKINRFLIIVFIFLFYILFLWKITLTNDYVAQADIIPDYHIFYHLLNSITQNKAVPYWNPYNNCGEPYLLWNTVGGTAIYQIRHLATSYVVKFLRIPFSFYKVFILDTYIFYFLIFFPGAYLLFKYILKYRFTALIVATLSLFFTTSYGINSDASVNIYIFIPWVMLYLTKIVREEDYRNILWFFLFAGLAVNAMSSYALMVSIMMAFYLVSLCIFFWPDIKVWKLLKRESLSRISIILGVVIFIAIVSPHALFYFQYRNDIHRYGRDIANIPIEYFGNFQLSPVVNSLFYKFGPEYMGIFAAILFLMGLIYTKNSYKLPLIIFVLSTLLFSLGENSFIFGIIYGGLFPFLRKVVYISPAGTILMNFVAMLFVGMGLDSIFNLFNEIDDESKRLKRLIYIILPLFALGICALPIAKALSLSKIPFYEVVSSTLLRGIFLLMSVVFFFMLFNRRKETRGLIIFLIFLLFTDFLTVNYQQMNRVFGKTDYKYRLKATDYKFTFYRTRAEDYNFESWQRLDPMLLKFFYIGSGMLCLKSFLYFNNYPDPSIKVEKLPQEKIDFFTGITQPTLYLTPKAIISNNDKQSFKLLSDLSLAQLRNTVIIQDEVEESFSPLIIKDAKINSPLLYLNDYKFSDINFSPNELSFNINTSIDGFLVYNDGYDRYWQAYVDGKPTRVYRTQINFKSIALRKGNHKVIFRYNPITYKILLGVSNVTIIIFLLSALLKSSSERLRQYGSTH